MTATLASIDSKRLLAMVRKETRQLARDPSTYLIAVAMPMILLFLFGFAVSLDTAQTRVALVMEDSSAPALELAQSYRASRYFHVESFRNRQDARAEMVRDRVRGMIVIPQDFGETTKSGRIPSIQVVTDGSQPNTAQLLSAHADGVFQNWLAAEARAAPGAPRIEVSPRMWFNPGIESRLFLVPGSIAIVMTLVGSVLTALVIAREWERGTMEAILATPITMPEFIASKVIPYYFLAIGSMTICTVLAMTVFGVPLRGSIIALYLVSSAFLMPALGLGLLISAVTKNQFAAAQISTVVSFLPTFLLSGFLYEISSMPIWIQAITYLVPARYLIPSLQTIFLTGDVWSLLIPNTLIMLGFGLFFFFMSFRATRRSLD